ncbi:MAG: Gfo/Idh/MocA family oxidoreductase [Bacteroidetes bacterium]|nr:Gfo/Idh/MocA family oxidoreductase [Bacteroidota bacterium]
MNISNKIRFAVIGQGHIGRRHAEMIRRNPDCELIAVCDILPENKTENSSIKEKYYLSAQEMLAAHPEIDIVNICTPNGLHAQHSLLALEAKKHIVCEKPMALSTADCKTVIQKAKETSRQVFCVMQNRYSPPSAWLKDIVSNNIIGNIFMVQLNCYWNRDERYYLPAGQTDKTNTWKGKQNLDGGTLFTQFSHFIDVMFWLFGDIRDIQAKFNDFTHTELTEFEDSGLVSFNFVNGGMGSINYSTAVWDTNLESSLTIIGSNGSVKVGGQYMDKVEYCHIKNYKMPTLPPTSPPNDYGSYKGSANNHHLIIQNVIDTLSGKAVSTTTPEEGLRVVDIIERIYSLRKDNRKS